MNKFVKISEVLEHESTPEEYLHQIDAHMTVTMEEQFLDLVAFIQWRNKMA